MSGATLPIVFADDLVEEALLGAIRGDPAERIFRRERDPLYRLPATERDAAFAECHRRWFERLGLGEPVRETIAELPRLAETCAGARVVRCLTRHDQKADLLVSPETRERIVLLRLGAASLADLERLYVLLRFELLHVADMVDPAFGYDPELPALDGGPSRERLVRERYRVLWDTTVSGRLARAGRMPAGTEEACRLEFDRAFTMLGEETGAVFLRFFAGTPRHADILGVALAPRSHEGEDRLARGGRCPLCRFPSYDLEPEPESLDDDVLAWIRGDTPRWRPSDGLCRQCADLYRARSLSLREARRLPGRSLA